MAFEVIPNSSIDQSTPGRLTVVNAVRINGVNYDVEVVGDAALPSLQDDPFLANRVKGLWTQLSQTIPTHHLESLQIQYTGTETTIQYQSLQGRVEHVNGQNVRFDLDKFKQDACEGDSFNQRFAPAGSLTAHGAVSYLFESALRRHYVSLPGTSSSGFGDSSPPQFAHPHSSTQVDLSSAPSSRRHSVSVSPTKSPQSHNFTSSPVPSPHAALRPVANGGATVELMEDSAASSPRYAATVAPVPNNTTSRERHQGGPRHFTFPSVPSPQAASTRVSKGGATVELIEESAASTPVGSPRHSATVAPWPSDVDARRQSARSQPSLGARLEGTTNSEGSSLPAASRSSDRNGAKVRPIAGSSTPVAAVSRKAYMTIAEAFKQSVLLKSELARLKQARAERDQASRTK